MNSSRLPGKVLFNISGKPALQQMIERIQLSKNVTRFIVATTNKKEDDKIVELCDSLNIGIYRGDEGDVLGRYKGAAEKFNAELVVRLTADCPMHDALVIDSVIDSFNFGKYDYVSNTVLRTYPDGLDVEVFSKELLDEIERLATHPLHREHVTTYVRGGIDGLEQGNYIKYDHVNSVNYSMYRWTLDTKEDFVTINKYFRNLPESFTWLQAIKLGKENNWGLIKN